MEVLSTGPLIETRAKYLHRNEVDNISVWQSLAARATGYPINFLPNELFDKGRKIIVQPIL